MIYLLLTVLFLFSFVQPARAYLDPGTGSYITQVMIGLLAGGTYLLKVYWHKIMDAIHSMRQKLTNQRNEK